MKRLCNSVESIKQKTIGMKIAAKHTDFLTAVISLSDSRMAIFLSHAALNFF